MKEKLYTIELNDALESGDECLFCWLERKLEQETLEFVLGSSYMESDIREHTDKLGFCRSHTRMMYDYGNSLGNAWIFKSRLEYMSQSLKKEMGRYVPESGGGLFGKRKQSGGGNCVESWIRSEESHCYVCNRMEEACGRMLDTFVHQLRHDTGFGDRLMRSGGVCIHHFADVLNVCEARLSRQEKETWIPKLFELMSSNLDRMQADIDWLIEKYDYRNQDADWKTSKDALPRTMQKIAGGYPADPVFQCKK